MGGNAERLGKKTTEKLSDKEVKPMSIFATV